MFSSLFTAAWAALVLLLLAAPQYLSAAGRAPFPQSRIVPSPEPDWPQWRGPRRDGISTETGLLREWPDGGPQLVWKSEAIGRGYSAPIIVRDRLYLAGEVGNALLLFALDSNGKTVWTATNGAAWKGPYPGARASATFSAGRIYHMNGHGRVGCYDAASGKELWAVPVQEQFDGKNITWARAECLIVDNDRVYVTAGGKKALAAALDAKTGATIWSTPPLTFSPVGGGPEKADQASYGSPVLIEFAGRRILVNSSHEHVFAVDVAQGQLLWTYHLPTRYYVIAATPVLLGDRVFVTAPDTERGGLLQMIPDGNGIKVQPVWTTRFDNCHGGLVPVGNELFGGWYRRGKGWAAVDQSTGAVRQVLDGLTMGSVLSADGRLYCLAQDGEMALVEPSSTGPYQVRGRLRLVAQTKNDAWTHPVILHGGLYLRYHENLFCFDVRQRNVR